MKTPIDEDDPARRVMRRFVKAFPVQAATLLRYERAAGLFSVFAHYVASPEFAAAFAGSEGATIPVDRTGMRPCLQGETLDIRDMSDFSCPDCRTFARFGLNSGVAAPLSIGNEIRGVIRVLRRERDGFTSAEVEMIHALAKQISFAMFQSRLCRGSTPARAQPVDARN